MKKEKMITRTITTTRFTCLAVNVNTCEVTTAEINLTGEYKTDKEKNDALAKASTDAIKYVTIRNIEVIEELYGMPESVFLEHAEKLPPRSKVE